MHLGDLTWPEVSQRAAAGALLAIPIGSTEQHGPHLPLSTDTDIAIALCERFTQATDVDVVVAPAVAYGSAGEHAGFAGTLSIGQEALEALLVELCRSASDTFSRVLLVSAHGGNTEPVARAVARLQGEGREVRSFAPSFGGDAHAGHTETSIQMTLYPERVRLDQAIPGDTRPLSQIMPELKSNGVASVSPSGVLGDPTRASAAAGDTFLDQAVAELVKLVAARSGVTS